MSTPSMHHDFYRKYKEKVGLQEIDDYYEFKYQLCKNIAPRSSKSKNPNRLFLFAGNQTSSIQGIVESYLTAFELRDFYHYGRLVVASPYYFEKYFKFSKDYKTGQISKRFDLYDKILRGKGTFLKFAFNGCGVTYHHFYSHHRNYQNHPLNNCLEMINFPREQDSWVLFLMCLRTRLLSSSS